MVKRLFKAICLTFILASCLCLNAYAANETGVDLPYEIKDGSTYYESSWGFGSGRYGIVGDNNIYTDIPCIVGLNGYAFLDNNGVVLISDFIEDETDIIIPDVPQNADTLFVHFSGPVYRNGWTDARNVVLRDEPDKIPPRFADFFYPDGLPVEPIDEGHAKSETFEEIVSQESSAINEEKSVDEVVGQIDVITQSSKTIIVVDVSGSMYDNQEKVLYQLNSIDLPSDTQIVAFAETSKIVSYQDLVERNYHEVGGSTNIYGSLNDIVQSDVETIVLISDLDDNHCLKLDQNSTVTNLIIYIPYRSDYLLSSFTSKINDKWSASIASYVISDQ